MFPNRILIAWLSGWFVSSQCSQWDEFVFLRRSANIWNRDLDVLDEIIILIYNQNYFYLIEEKPEVLYTGLKSTGVNRICTESDAVITVSAQSTDTLI